MNSAASAKEAVNHDNDVTHEDRGGSPPVKLRTHPYGDRRRSSCAAHRGVGPRYCPRVCFTSVVVTANPRVAVPCPRVARVVIIIITVRAVSEAQAKAECRPAEKAPTEVPTVKAALKASASKATANKPAARKARSNTSARKVATSDPGAAKLRATLPPANPPPGKPRVKPPPPRPPRPKPPPPNPPRRRRSWRRGR